ATLCYCLPIPRRKPNPRRFPTRRSSDLAGEIQTVAAEQSALEQRLGVRRVQGQGAREVVGRKRALAGLAPGGGAQHERLGPARPDRKSTRLNCSHGKISYADLSLK